MKKVLSFLLFIFLLLSTAIPQNKAMIDSLKKIIATGNISSTTADAYLALGYLYKTKFPDSTSLLL